MEWLMKLLGLHMDEDTAREKRIQHYLDQMVRASTPMQRRHYWRLMRKEVNSRSPEQVARMERERGIV